MEYEDWYVYTLAWHTGLIFYVGRGRGHRWDVHEQKALRGENCRVTDTICEIWLRGEALIKKKHLENVTEEDAYTYQFSLYMKYATLNNTMLSPGGYPRAVGHGNKIADSRKANGHSKWSPETKEKFSKTRIGRSYPKERKAVYKKRNMAYLNTPETIAKRGITMRGRMVSQETRAKMSDAKKRFMSSISEEEKLNRLEAWIEAGQKASSRKLQDTSIEKIIEQKLIADNESYVKQYKVGAYHCDFYIPTKNTIVEVNGCFIHQCPECGWNNHRTEEIRAKDAKKLAYLQSKGYTVNVIWEHSIDGHKVRLPKKGDK